MYLRSLLGLANHFKKDERGNIALIAGLLLVPMVGTVGYGIDYTRAVTYRMKLDSAASSASLAGVEMARAYLLANPKATPAEVAAAGEKRALEVFNARAPAADASFFADVVKVMRVGDTLSAKIDYSGSVKTVVANIFTIDSIGVSGTANSNGPLKLGNEPDDPDNPNVIISENFQNVGKLERGGYWGLRTNWNNWATSSAGGVEIGKYSTYKVEKPPNGAELVAELDSSENNSMSKKVFLTAGDYELRYLYRDRVSFPTYNPAWLCGSATEDVDWANDPNGRWGYQTNRIGVYLHVAPTDEPPKLYEPKKHNLVDVCASTGDKWVQRSIKITIKATGFFWLAFQAEGANDSYGGLLTSIQLCRGVCPGELIDDFPWAERQLLFKDDFYNYTLPLTSAAPNPSGLTPGSYGWWMNGTLQVSGENTGWPLLPTGWSTAPVNQMDFNLGIPSPLGGNGLDIDASDGNRAISRRFLLTPGYYRVVWTYASRIAFAEFGSEVFCGSAATANAQRFIGSGVANHNPLLTTGIYDTISTFSRSRNTNQVSAFMDADRLVSHPTHSDDFYAPAIYKNPDGAEATLPNLPQQKLDTCAYSSTWQTREIDVKVTKPGLYWLSFRGEGASDNTGGQLANFRMYGLGGLRMSGPPPNWVAIDAPGVPAGEPIVLNNMVLTSQ